METIAPNPQIVQIPASSIQDWYEPFIKLLFKYPQIHNVRTDQLLGLSSKTDLPAAFPNWDAQMVQLKQKDDKKRKNELKGIANYVDEFFFISKDKATYLLSFLHHLRNAIAHGTVSFVAPYVEIKDYPYNPQTKRLSNTANAYCRIRVDNLKKFFKILTDHQII